MLFEVKVTIWGERARMMTPATIHTPMTNQGCVVTAFPSFLNQTMLYLPLRACAPPNDARESP